MAHYALLDIDNIVIDVITGVDENDKTNLPKEFESWEEFYANELNATDCKRTSFNTSGNQHALDKTPFRANYAGIGYTYDADNDVFIPPKPTTDATLNEETWLWEIKE
tara:strand:- start:66 stop:389 length:324 start_codon:yes stop_codon:yes gene_type:complete